jgi:hypothetical protein
MQPQTLADGVGDSFKGMEVPDVMRWAQLLDALWVGKQKSEPHRENTCPLSCRRLCETRSLRLCIHSRLDIYVN